MKKRSKERRKELAAASIFVTWVVAWIVSLYLKTDIPQAINVVMPMASATLLGIQLPVGPKKEK